MTHSDGTRPIDDISRLLNSGKSYIEAGLLEFALLQIIIAAEIATTRFIDKMLQAAGVSKSKLNDYRADLTFSQKLNIYLFALCPPGMKPQRQLIGSIDRGRKLRNDVMHEGVFNANRDEIYSLYVDIVKYLEFLDKILKSRGLN